MTKTTMNSFLLQEMEEDGLLLLSNLSLVITMILKKREMLLLVQSIHNHINLGGIADKQKKKTLGSVL